MANETIQTTEQVTTSDIDYRAEYEKAKAETESLRAEVEKQKSMKDKYAKESSDLRKKQEAQMTEEEKRAQEMQDAIDRATKAEQELAKLQLEKSGISAGFSAEEVKKIIDGQFSFSEIRAVLDARVEEAVRSAKAQMAKSSSATPLVGNGTAGGTTLSAFQQHQSARVSQMPTSEVKL